MLKEELTSACLAAKATLPALVNNDARCEMLFRIAQALDDNLSSIIEANKTDLAAAKASGISDAMYDRLTLTEERLHAISESVRCVASLPDPLGKVSEKTIEKGLLLTQMKVPLGVIAMIYEARPNVTVDAAVLSVKSGNAVILRGGKEAINTNRAIVKIMKEALKPFGAYDSIYLIEDTTHESVNVLLTLRGYIDLVIPRGGKGLIRAVVDNSKIPVIETGAGNCHIYVNKSADLRMATDITVNAKTSRPSVCNAAENLLIDREIAEKFLPYIGEELKKHGVELRADAEAKKYLPFATLATDEDFYTEYNDYIMTVGIVSDVKEAVAHINKYGTKHSEAIVTEDTAAAEYFMSGVDAAAVYHNASTRFTDGGVYGMGAEIGISTQKLHVRGPFALDALTTTKYCIYGNGQVR